MSDSTPHTHHSDDARPDEGAPTDAMTDDVRQDAAQAESERTSSPTDRGDVAQPQDHLPPSDERDADADPDEPSYPDSGAPAGGSSVSPDTAAEPDKPKRHGVDRIPPTGR